MATQMDVLNFNSAMILDEDHRVLFAEAQNCIYLLQMRVDQLQDTLNGVLAESANWKKAYEDELADHKKSVADSINWQEQAKTVWEGQLALTAMLKEEIRRMLDMDEIGETIRAMVEMQIEHIIDHYDIEDPVIDRVQTEVDNVHIEVKHNRY